MPTSFLRANFIDMLRYTYTCLNGVYIHALLGFVTCEVDIGRHCQMPTSFSRADFIDVLRYGIHIHALSGFVTPSWEVGQTQ